MESKNQELSRAVEELSKLVKDSGEGNTRLFICPPEKCHIENLTAPYSDHLSKSDNMNQSCICV